MSLKCKECRNVISPTLELPGRHAVQVYPWLPIIAYFIENGVPKPSLTIDRLWIHADLCLECIEKAINLSNNLTSQTRFQDFYRFSQWMLEYESQEDHHTKEHIQECHQKLNDHEAFMNFCLLCNKKINQESRFEAAEYDRAENRKREKEHAEQSLARRLVGAPDIDEITEEDPMFRFFGPIYHISLHNPIFGPSFQFCIECFGKAFPRIFHLFGQALTHKGDETPEVEKEPSIMIKAKLLRELAGQLGPDEIKKQLSELEEFGLKVI